MLRPTALSLTLVLATGCGGGAELGESDLLLLWTSNVHGYIEPCGCQFGMIGGIDRIASYIAEERAAHPASLWIDGGDLVSETIPKEDVPLLVQLPLKARAMFEVWGEIGCDALALGEDELALGHGRIRDWSLEFDVPVICANLVDAAGDLVFERSVVLERGGLRIGVFSVIVPKLREALVESNERIDVSELAASQGLRLLPWRQTAIRVAEELAADCDLVLFASHAGSDNNVRVARETDAIDLAFGGHFGKVRQELTWTENDVPVLLSAVRGARVGRVEWWFEDIDDYLEPGGRERMHDVSKWVFLKQSAEIASVELADLEGREAGTDSKEWERSHLSHSIDLAHFEDELRGLGAPPVGNKIAAVQPPMYFGIPRSELALDAIDDYHGSVNEFWHGRGTKPMEGGAFVGAETCRGCHTRQYEFWRATGHSRAFSTLEATGQEVDAECIGCHTVGYREAGGFPAPNRYPGRENVQCESCHGPAARHVRGGDSFLEPGVLSSGLFGCARCHNDDHDPEFKEQGFQRLALVSCPPLELPGKGSPALLTTYRVIAERLAERDEPDWGEVADLWHRAGELERAIEASERWLVQDPRDLQALVLTGMRYLEAGRHNDALPLFRRVAKRQPNNANGHLGLGASLLPSDPESAGYHASEAFSILPSGDAVELLARASLAMGRPTEARDALEAWLEDNPRDTARFAPLLESLPEAPRDPSGG